MILGRGEGKVTNAHYRILCSPCALRGYGTSPAEAIFLSLPLANHLEVLE